MAEQAKPAWQQQLLWAVFQVLAVLLLIHLPANALGKQRAQPRLWASVLMDVIGISSHFLALDQPSLDIVADWEQTSGWNIFSISL